MNDCSWGLSLRLTMHDAFDVVDEGGRLFLSPNSASLHSGLLTFVPSGESINTSDRYNVCNSG